jgi:glycine oxidase
VLRGTVQGRDVYVVGRPCTPGDRSGARREIVVGATTEEAPDDHQPRAGATFALLRDARALVPSLDEAVFVEATQRARPATPDLLPAIGASGVPGLAVATGHYRNGVLLAPLTAAAIESWLCDCLAPSVLEAADPRRFTTMHHSPSKAPNRLEARR